MGCHSHHTTSYNGASSSYICNTFSTVRKKKSRTIRYEALLSELQFPTLRDYSNFAVSGEYIDILFRTGQINQQCVLTYYNHRFGPIAGILPCRTRHSKPGPGSGLFVLARISDRNHTYAHIAAACLGIFCCICFSLVAAHTTWCRQRRLGSSRCSTLLNGKVAKEAIE